MDSRDVSDRRLTCSACGDDFIFSAGEQQLFALRGIERQPDRCPSCSRGRTVLTRPQQRKSR